MFQYHIGVLWICSNQSDDFSLSSFAGSRSPFPIPRSPFTVNNAKRFDGEFAIDACHDDVAVGGAEGAVDDEEVAVLYPGADHGVARDAHEVRRGRPLHEEFIQVERRLDVLLGRRREPRHHGADNTCLAFFHDRDCVSL